MTFDHAAWAINGATLSGAMARRAEFTATNGNEGIVNSGDLKVTALSTPGVGVQISPGVGLVLNRYQTNPNETYTVSNPDIHTIPSSQMPASNPSTRSYLVAIVVGDPDFSQVGHPWMGAGDPPEGEETTFEYVRPTLIQVAAGTTSAASLGYPALALARIDIPANTTTITNSMIHDLREFANPRSTERIGNFVQGSDIVLANQQPVGIPWPQTVPILTARVPMWATAVNVMGYLEGLMHPASLSSRGDFLIYSPELNKESPYTVFNYTADPGNSRQENVNSLIGGRIPIDPAFRGQTISFLFRARLYQIGVDLNSLFALGIVTTGMIRATFLEESVG